MSANTLIETSGNSTEMAFLRDLEEA